MRPARLGPHRAAEPIIEGCLRICGYATIAMVVLIIAFILKEGIPLFRDYPLTGFLFGRSWQPLSATRPAFGILPLLAGSALITLAGTALAVPVAIAAASYIAEVAPQGSRDLLKSGVELLSGVPSIVFGFLGMLIVVPLVKELFGLGSGLTALAGAIVLAVMALPLIVTVAEDALRAQPQSYREASLALGASRWDTIVRVLLPAARSGLTAAMMLGVGRILGETMAVMMVTGNAGIIPGSLLVPARALTATIAAEMGETVHYSDHYRALFAIGAVLLVLSLGVNWAAAGLRERGKPR